MADIPSSPERHEMGKTAEMNYKTEVEIVKARKIITVYYDREKEDDHREAIEFVRKKSGYDKITIIAKPKQR